MGKQKDKKWRDCKRKQKRIHLIEVEKEGVGEGVVQVKGEGKKEEWKRCSIWRYNDRTFQNWEEKRHQGVNTRSSI